MGNETKEKRLTDAAFAILTGNESLVADAIVAVVRVDTLSVLADALLLALVRLFALVRLLVPLLAGRALAFEGSDGVDALAAFAQGRDRLAFVDIFITKTSSSMNHPNKDRVKFLTDALAAMDVPEESFVAVQLGRALLAGMSPSFPHCGTAELLGADDALELALAHVVPHSRETGARPVI